MTLNSLRIILTTQRLLFRFTKAIRAYQDRFKSEAEISAMIAADESQNQASNIEKKLDICIKIKQLPKSKVKALQAFLDGLGVEFDVDVME